ncbi:MAG TPA: DNA polymerase III subunit delta [Bacilli bacterium]|nr:DNA polymerase III subunit delta [Bacilli bacterium]
MVYLFYSKETFLIKKEIQKIISDNNIDEININTFDLNEDSIKDVIDDSETFSMFDDKKIIIVNNAYVFTAKKNNIVQDPDLLDKYLNNVNPSTILIFTILDSKPAENRKIVKTIKKIGTVKDLDYNKDINTIIKNMFEPYKIDYSLCTILSDRVGDNLSILNNEIEKIKIYKDKDLTITKDDIINNTHENIEANMFLLIDMIISKNKEKAISIYHEMLDMNEETIAIVIALANKIRSLYQTKELYKKGYSESDIASILGVKPGYLYYLKDSLRRYDSETLFNILNKLIDLDYNIKSGNIEKNLGFELFILEN